MRVENKTGGDDILLGRSRRRRGHLVDRRIESRRGRDRNL